MSKFVVRLKNAIGIAPPRRTAGGVHIHVNERGGLSVNPGELVRSPRAKELMREVADMRIGSGGRTKLK